VTRIFNIFFPASITLSAVVILSSCSDSESGRTPEIYAYEIVRTYPHDAEAFTQGLVFEDGLLYESTGFYGRSTLRKVQLETGDILQIYKLPDELFGEGMTIYDNRIIQLTWKSNLGLVYDKDSFQPLGQFSYRTEGWGITHDGQQLIMSDGTSTLHFLNPETFQQTGRIDVRDGDSPVNGLNELEYVKGKIYANVWPTEKIAIIAPQSGRLVGWIRMAGPMIPQDDGRALRVLNGIAYDTTNDRLFVTGKLWPNVFEIELVRSK